MSIVYTVWYTKGCSCMMTDGRLVLHLCGLVRNGHGDPGCEGVDRKRQHAFADNWPHVHEAVTRCQGSPPLQAERRSEALATAPWSILWEGAEAGLTTQHGLTLSMECLATYSNGGVDKIRYNV